MTYDTLETAQARILELDDQIAELTSERNSLSENNELKDQEIADLRTQNQKYFNRLIAQDRDTEKDEEKEEPEIPTCEEFAKDILKKGF